MRELPKDGLIVSCYLETMMGTERPFIAAVANLSGVVALRVEGIDNIEFARKIAPDKFIIGLIKEFDASIGRSRITPDLLTMGRAIIEAGADMVAAEDIYQWCCDNNAILNSRHMMGFALPFKVMYDMKHEDVYDRPQEMVDLITAHTERGELILATTFMQKAFGECAVLRRDYRFAKINVEGGIESHEEVGLSRRLGANYVTVGKVINDPVTIIKRLIEG